MRIHAGTLCALAAFTSCASAHSLQPRIVGGTEVADELPWMTQLYTVQDDMMTVTYGQCGGTLIAPQWTAHCALGRDDKIDTSVVRPTQPTPKGPLPSKMAFVGSNFPGLGPRGFMSLSRQAVPIAEVVCHPDFAVGTLRNDICLWKLATPVSNTPVKLNLGKDHVDEGSMLGSKGVIMGWGREKESADLTSPNLLKAEIPLLPMLQCTRQYMALQKTAYYSPNGICAGGQKGVDTCQGDSGGPLLTPDYKQVGITSFGFGCARNNLPATYTKISAYQDWIEKVTGLTF